MKNFFKNLVQKHTWVFGLPSLFGFFGIKGQPGYLLYFTFLGFFGFIWTNKLGDISDERLNAIHNLAGLHAFRISLSVSLVISIIMAQLSYYMNLDFEFLYRAQLAIFALALGGGSLLWCILTYRYDQRDEWPDF